MIQLKFKNRKEQTQMKPIVNYRYYTLVGKEKYRIKVILSYILYQEKNNQI
jgi:hypothetical protein